MTVKERGTGFEERLLAELRREVVERSAGAAPERQPARPLLGAGWRRRVALAGAVATALAVGVGVGVPLLSGDSPAYAVTSNADGTVTVEIRDLRDAAGLERELREAGLPAVVRYLPLGKACKEPWFTPFTGEAGPSKGSVTLGSGAGTSAKGDPPLSPARFTIDPGDLPAGVTLVITTQTGAAPNAPAGSPVAISVAYAQGEVGECEVVDAPAGSPAAPAPSGGERGPGAVRIENGKVVSGG